MIRLGIIGLGTMGKHILAGALAHPRFKVLSIFDTHKPDLVGEQYQDIELAATVLAMLSRDDIDLIYIGTPPDTHIDYCHLCLDAGKAIWCEKPLATDLVTAKGLIARVEALEAKVAINLSLATSPIAIALEERVAKLHKPSLQRVEIRLNFSRWPRLWQQGASQWLDSRAQGGFMREVFSHLAFIHHRMLGTMTLLESQLSYPHPLRSETAVSASYLSTGSSAKIPVDLIGSVGSNADELVQWTLYFNQAEQDQGLHTECKQGAIRFQNWDTLLLGENDLWQALTLDNQGSILTQLNEVDKMMRNETHRLASIQEAFEVQCLVEATLANNPHFYQALN